MAEKCALLGVLDAEVATYPDLRDKLFDEPVKLDCYVRLFVECRIQKCLPNQMKTVIDGTQTIKFFPAVAGG